MASVFLSYDREDAGKARPIALALEKAGHSVWWDLHVRGGAQFSKVIEEALKASDAVVVLWSERSVESAWVRDEASAGRDSGRLVPVSLDKTEPPIGFRQFQAIDLSRWKGRRRIPHLDELLDAVVHLGGSGGSAVAPPPIASVESGVRIRPVVALGVAALVLIAIVSALLLWRPWAGRSSIPVIAVAAASPSAEANALARDLLTKLGALQGAKTDELNLVQGDQSSRDADFIFEVGGGSHGQLATANLVLLGGKDRSLLWSRTFERPRANDGDLKQQLAYTAALVLDCTLEGLTTGGKRLDQATLKVYLNACSTSADADAQSGTNLVAMFRDVVSKAPEFEAAWAKLLLAESEAVDQLNFTEYAGSTREELSAHIAAARKLNPRLAEADMAEVTLVPQSAIAKRVGLLERAVDNDPRNAAAASLLSRHLQTVGRMRDAVSQARRAVQLAPLWPSARDALVSALTYSGEIEAAAMELEKAERLWPGATNLREARYRLHLRYGDPHEALRLQADRSDIVAADVREAFLQARIEPSPANIDRAVAGPSHWFSRYPQAIAEYAQVLGAFEREEELFPILLGWSHPDKVGWVTDVLFRPALRELHHDPRMIAVARRLGLLDYWQSSGHWPDFCFEPGLPYDCKKEAARLAS